MNAESVSPFHPGASSDKEGKPVNGTGSKAPSETVRPVEKTPGETQRRLITEAKSLREKLSEALKRHEGDRASRLAALNLMEDAVLARNEMEKVSLSLRESEGLLARQTEALQAAVQGAPLEKSLGVLARAAVDKAGVEVRCGIYLLNSSRAELVHVAGMPEAYAECVDGFKVGLDSLACGLAVHTRQPVITPDVRKDDLWKEWLWLAERYDFRGCWSFPIEADDKVFGTLALYFREPREVGPGDHEFAGVLTQTAAIIISRTQDAAERAHAVARLTVAEERLRLLVDSAVEHAIASMDRSGMITSWNSGAERIFGYNSEEIRGKSADLIFSLEDRAAGVPAAERKQALEEGRAGDNRWLQKKDGSRLWANGSVLPMRPQPAGEVIGFVKILRDDTEMHLAKEAVETHRVRLVEALNENQQAREELEAAGKAKDHFLAVLSHELRTPLTPVLMAARTLARRKDLSPQVHEAMEMIERNIQIEARFIDDLLDVTRIARGKMEIVFAPLDLHQVVHSAVEICRSDLEAKNQTLSLELNAQRTKMEGDPERLQQVIWNLLKNAAKFTPKQGKLTIRTSDTPDSIQLEVVDTGIGMTPDAMEHIFDPFSQANQEITREFGGLGLGLAISMATVTAHGGLLRAESRGADQGSTFVVLLPRSRPTTALG